MFLRIKLTRVYMLAIFCTCIFLTGGVYTPYSPCMSTPLLCWRRRRLRRAGCKPLSCKGCQSVCCRTLYMMTSCRKLIKSLMSSRRCHLRRSISASQFSHHHHLRHGGERSLSPVRVSGENWSRNFSYVSISELVTFGEYRLA